MTAVAAVDVGTNTVRLLVCDDGRQLDRAQEITRLGKGVDASGRLDGESIRRSADAVARFVARARKAGAARIRIAGTSALRDAADADAFVTAVRDATALDVHILDGETEGRCAYRGATGWLPSDGAYVVCDIGGGSTELITAANTISIDVGSVRVRERFLASDPPTTDEVTAARAAITDAIFDSARSVVDGGEQLVGVAGTITTLAALALELDVYDSRRVHGSRLTRADIDAWSRRLLAMPAGEIAAIGVVQLGREDVIGAGSLILSVVMEVLEARDVVVSERDILDGLVAELLG